MRNILILLALVSLMSCNSSSKTSEEVPVSVGVSDNAFSVGEVIITVTKSDYKSIVAELEQTEGVVFEKLLMKGDNPIILMHVPAGQEEHFIEVFKKNANVKYAELNGTMSVN